MLLLERKLGSSNLSSEERLEALVRLGKLNQLSGNLEAAADAWNRAALADPKKGDYRSVLEGIRCYIALGELEKAETGIRMVLANSKDAAELRSARYLGSLTDVFRTGDHHSLERLLDSHEYPDETPLLLYFLWKITGDEIYQARLRAEYPLSPEAKSLTSPLSHQIAGASTPMWLLFPGRGSVVLETPVTRTFPEAAPGGNTVPASAVKAAASPREAASPGEAASPRETVSQKEAVSQREGPASGTALLQTGLFSKEENAKRMADQLKKAGFTPVVSRRTVNGRAYFMVAVSPGNDINASLLRLKNAGFESFPVY
jgi:tetratricopeptide (TPR) repeat protein